LIGGLLLFLVLLRGLVGGLALRLELLLRGFGGLALGFVLLLRVLGSVLRLMGIVFRRPLSFRFPNSLCGGGLVLYVRPFLLDSVGLLKCLLDVGLGAIRVGLIRLPNLLGSVGGPLTDPGILGRIPGRLLSLGRPAGRLASGQALGLRVLGRVGEDLPGLV